MSSCSSNKEERDVNDLTAFHYTKESSENCSSFIPNFHNEAGTVASVYLYQQHHVKIP